MIANYHKLIKTINKKKTIWKILKKNITNFKKINFINFLFVLFL